MWDEKKRKGSPTVDVFLCELVLRSIILFFSDNQSARDSRGGLGGGNLSSVIDVYNRLNRHLTVGLFYLHVIRLIGVFV